MAIFEEKQSDANARQRNYSGENGSESKREGGREKKNPADDDDNERNWEENASRTKNNFSHFLDNFPKSIVFNLQKERTRAREQRACIYTYSIARFAHWNRDSTRRARASIIHSYTRIFGTQKWVAVRRKRAIRALNELWLIWGDSELWNFSVSMSIWSMCIVILCINS